MKNVLVGVSGGIDSTVAALLLRNENWNVSLCNLLTWRHHRSGSCKESRNIDIQTVGDDNKKIFYLAQKLKIPFYVVDVREYFFKNIVCGFMDGYCSGITPNPCVECNKYIKFKTLYYQALDLGCEHIATGHYANIGQHEGRYFVKKGVDKDKDQSYFLWALPQQYLKKIIFPLGQRHKSAVKRYAQDNNLTMWCLEKESEDICFLPNGDYRDLLHHYKTDEIASCKEGPFMLGGKVVGRHQGYPFYTIGQRRGLGISLGFPVFVQRIDPCSNTIFLCREENLRADSMLVTGINFQKYETIDDGFICRVKIRYHSDDYKCTVSWVDAKTVRVLLEEDVRAITPGQSAVFYEGEDIVFGGVIIK